MVDRNHSLAPAGSATLLSRPHCVDAYAARHCMNFSGLTIGRVVPLRQGVFSFSGTLSRGIERSSCQAIDG